MAELFTLEELAALRNSDELEAVPGEVARTLATGAVRGFCGWHVAPVQTDELTWTVLAGSTNHDSGELVVGVDANISLPTLQLVSAPIVTLAGPEVITDFSWWREGELARETGWGLVDDQITVEIEHGYAEGSFQHQLVKGIALGVAARVRAPAEGQQPTAELTPGEQDQLHPYRLITIA